MIHKGDTQPEEITMLEGVKLKGKNYQYRKRIPTDVCEHPKYKNRKEKVLNRSLRTGDPVEANRRAANLLAEMENEWAACRRDLESSCNTIAVSEASSTPVLPFLRNSKLTREQIDTIWISEYERLEHEAIAQRGEWADFSDEEKELVLSTLYSEFEKIKPQGEDVPQAIDWAERAAYQLQVNAASKSDLADSDFSYLKARLRAVAEEVALRDMDVLEGKPPQVHDRLLLRDIEKLRIAPKSGVGAMSEDSLADKVLEKLQPILERGEAVQEVTLLELCESHLAGQEGNANKSIAAVKGMTVMCRAVWGDDTLIHTIDTDALKRFIDFLSALPAGIAVGNDPLVYLEKVNAKLEGDEGYNEQSAKTYENKWDLVKWLFNHAVEAFPSAMPKNLLRSKQIKNYAEMMTSTGQKRGVKEFEVAQLNEIFRQPLYTGHASLDSFGGWKKEGKQLDRKSGRYWAPLFMLFHGCRLNEIAQMMPEDVDIEAEVPYVRISPHYGVEGEIATPKRLKNKNSNRIVPLHPELIKCGFIDFVRERKSEGALWLFPEWVPAQMRDWKLGDAVTKTKGKKHSDLASDHCLKLYLTVIEEAQKPRPNSHSFRHGVMTQFYKTDVPILKAEQILGWDDQKNDSMTKVYGNKQLVEVLYPEVLKIQFEGLDISHLYTENHKPQRRRRPSS